jgi:hypothetical protein
MERMRDVTPTPFDHEVFQSLAAIPRGARMDCPDEQREPYGFWSHAKKRKESTPISGSPLKWNRSPLETPSTWRFLDLRKLRTQSRLWIIFNPANQEDSISPFT